MHHQVFDMNESSQVGEARRASVQMAGRLDFDEATCGRLALVVTELCTNLVRHAQGGRLLVAVRAGLAGDAIEVLAVDSGPGMADVEHCLRDGVTTSTTPGTGLGAVHRLSDEFAAFSAAPGGTVVLARIAPRCTGAPLPATGRFSHGAVAVPAAGEARCGDAWAIVQCGYGGRTQRGGAFDFRFCTGPNDFSSFTSRLDTWLMLQTIKTDTKSFSQVARSRWRPRCDVELSSLD